MVCCQNELTPLLVTKQPIATDAQSLLLSRVEGEVASAQ